MEQTAVQSDTLAGSFSGDLSIWGLFVQADFIVQAVMIGLLFASFWCWAIIFEKVVRMRRLRVQAGRFEENFWSGGSLDDLFDRVGARPIDPMAAIFSAAMREWRRSMSRTGRDRDGSHQSVAERIDRVMQITLNRELEQLERYMTFLASVGSTAPFVGLFGTVWGIMNSFTAIAMSKNTSLAVVAPGIAEALFATALGLVAAIPAVIAYNKLSTDINRYAGRLEGFAGEFGAILSRQSDNDEG
ncbi:MAG: protein TolQ [Pseudomonadota bacterium]|nr:protein TolQ [Pseudomonadota bacterium]